MHNITKKPVQIGFPTEVFIAVRNAAIGALQPYETHTGSFQRWVLQAVMERLDRHPGGYMAAFEPEAERPRSMMPEPGSVDEAVQKIAQLAYIENKPGQYPPTASKARNQRAVWEEELKKRRAKMPPAKRVIEDAQKAIEDKEARANQEWITKNQQPGEAPLENYQGDDIV